jgi:uncharacterized membrane protein
LNVLDLRSALLAKHAQHVVLIHFPIALFLAGVGFDFAAQWAKRAIPKTAIETKPTILAAAAYANLLAAAVSVPPVVTSGILAWRWQLEGQRLHGILLFHLVLGCLSGLLIATIGWMHFRGRRTLASRSTAYRLPLEFVTALLVVTTAHLGGFLSGVNVPQPPLN